MTHNPRRRERGGMYLALLHTFQCNRLMKKILEIPATNDGVVRDPIPGILT
jgi:hypothetical protein